MSAFSDCGVFFFNNGLALPYLIKSLLTLHVDSSTTSLYNICYKTESEIYNSLRGHL